MLLKHHIRSKKRRTRSISVFPRDVTMSESVSPQLEAPPNILGDGKSGCSEGRSGKDLKTHLELSKRESYSDRCRGSSSPLDLAPNEPVCGGLRVGSSAPAWPSNTRRGPPDAATSRWRPSLPGSVLRLNTPRLNMLKPSRTQPPHRSLTPRNPTLLAERVYTTFGLDLSTYALIEEM